MYGNEIQRQDSESDADYIKQATSSTSPITLQITLGAEIIREDNFNHALFCLPAQSVSAAPAGFLHSSHDAISFQVLHLQSGSVIDPCRLWPLNYTYIVLSGKVVSISWDLLLSGCAELRTAESVEGGQCGMSGPLRHIFSENHAIHNFLSNGSKPLVFRVEKGESLVARCGTVVSLVALEDTCKNMPHG